MQEFQNNVNKVSTGISRRKLVKLLSAGTAGFCLSDHTQRLLAQSSPVSYSPRDRMTMAYFFSWYNWPNPLNLASEHFITERGTDYLSVHPVPQTVSYDRNPNYSVRKPPNVSGNPVLSYCNKDWFISQLSSMSGCGIDVAAVDFWGFPWADVPPRSRLSLEVMNSAMDIMDSQRRLYPRIAMFLESKPISVLGRPTDLNTEDGAQYLFSIIRDFYSRINPQRVALFEGRVPVILYEANIKGLVVAPYGINRANQLFKAWYGRELAFFGNSTWKSKCGSGIRYTCHWGSAIRTSRYVDSTNLAQISPGYNYLGNTKGTPPDSSAYKDAWSNLRRGGANWVAIETWNEWHEGTGIGETAEYGKAFLNITKDQINLFKQRR